MALVKLILMICCASVSAGHLTLIEPHGPVTGHLVVTAQVVAKTSLVAPAAGQRGKVVIDLKRDKSQQLTVTPF